MDRETFLVFELFRGLLAKTRTPDQFYSNPRMILHSIEYSRYVKCMFEQVKKSRFSNICKLFSEVQ